MFTHFHSVIPCYDALMKQISKEEKLEMEELTKPRLAQFSHQQISEVIAGALGQLTGAKYTFRITSWASPDTWPEKIELSAKIQRDYSTPDES